MLSCNRYKTLFYIIKKYVSPFLWQQFAILLLQVLSISITIVIPVVGMRLIDQVFIVRNLLYLPYFLTAFIVLLMTKILIDLGVNRIIASMSENIAYQIRKDMVTKIHEYHYSFLNSVSEGDVIARFFTDVALVEGVVSVVILSIISDFLTIVGITFALVRLKPEFLLIILLTIPLYIFISHKLKNDIHRSTHNTRVCYSNVTKTLQDNLIFMKAIQELNLQHFFLLKFFKPLQNLKELNLCLANKEIRASFILQIIGNLGLILTFLYSSWITVIGIISVGAWTAVNNYVAKIYEPLKRLLNLNITIQKILVSADRIYQLLIDTHYSNLLKGKAK